MDFDYEKIQAELSAIKAMNQKWELRRKSLESLKSKREGEKEEDSLKSQENEPEAGRQE
jgi:hypothetical protein